MKRRVDAIAVAVMTVLLIGITMPALARNKLLSNREKTTNNLKMIGLAFQNHNDTYGCLPNNGGANTEKDLVNVNYGWHSPNVRDSGTWVTQIAPFMEMDPLHKNNVFVGVEPPKLPEKYPEAQFWQFSIKLLLCAERGRAGFSTSREAGFFPGPVTDFAINAFLHAPPTAYSNNNAGYAMGNVESGTNGDWAAANSRMTVQGITDGSSNTILVGGKALPPMAKADAPKNSPEEENCAPVPKGDATIGSGDEGIFSPGNWSIKGKVKTLTSTGTARGHAVVKLPPKDEPKEYPKDGGVPWMFEDSELKGDKSPPYSQAWGGPFKEGVLFMFGDGTVRFLKYSQRGTVNFARLLYTGDGQVVTFDD